MIVDINRPLVMPGDLIVATGPNDVNFFSVPIFPLNGEPALKKTLVYRGQPGLCIIAWKEAGIVALVGGTMCFFNYSQIMCENRIT